MTIITFSDGSTLAITTNDSISPIKLTEQGIPSMDKARPVEWNIHNGAIPFLLALFSRHNYFFVNDDQNHVYNANTIVSITTTE